MDPSACWKRLLDAVSEGDEEEAKSAAIDLGNWFAAGGFVPKEWAPPPAERTKTLHPDYVVAILRSKQEDYTRAQERLRLENESCRDCKYEPAYPGTVITLCGLADCVESASKKATHRIKLKDDCSCHPHAKKLGQHPPVCPAYREPPASRYDREMED